MRLKGLHKLKKASDPIGTQTRNVLASSIVPQPTTLSRALVEKISSNKNWVRAYMKLVMIMGLE
jgi:hypothetical protein